MARLRTHSFGWQGNSPRRVVHPHASMIMRRGGTDAASRLGGGAAKRVDKGCILEDFVTGR
jgi:hypothetical protein